jgi:hypothetical protein
VNNTRTVSAIQHVRNQPSIGDRRFLLAVQSGNIKATRRYVTQHSENVTAHLRTHD